ncbi:hypothetical protein ACQEVC_45360 [Plantactinospora sp. CA-294935]|uniref:hypothetical protein n=1 Tax=Plantactinospora sp. CA-294935 TaxID=3240012 RepID=UPI003D8F1DEC
MSRRNQRHLSVVPDPKAVAQIMATVPQITLTADEAYELGERAVRLIETADPSWTLKQLLVELEIELFVPGYLIAPALVTFLRAQQTRTAVA